MFDGSKKKICPEEINLSKSISPSREELLEEDIGSSITVNY